MLAAALLCGVPALSHVRELVSAAYWDPLQAPSMLRRELEPSTVSFACPQQLQAEREEEAITLKLMRRLEQLKREKALLATEVRNCSTLGLLACAGTQLD